MAVVEWDDIEKPQKGFGSGKSSGGSNKFKRLEANSENRIRLVLKPVLFYKYYNHQGGQLRSGVTDDPDGCTVKAKYPELKAQKRYACLIFDRDDDNNLKILEGPSSLFDNFRAYKKMAKNDPGGKDAGDFLIKVICPNGKKDRDTTYEVEFIEPVPFTDEEKSFVKENLEEYNLENIFKAHSPEDLESKLFGDGKTAAQREREAEYQAKQNGGSSASAQSSGGTETAKADDNDPFNF